MKYSAIVKTIQSLPPLSNSAFEIQQMYSAGAENVNVIKLVKIIESDAVLAANVLRMINAPAYGFSRQIASVAQAVTLFGTQIIYGMVVNYSISEKLKANIEPYGLTNEKFNDLCHLQSALMNQWYSKIDLRHAQFLTPLALIMESGKLILANEINKASYTKEFRKALRRCSDPIKYENDLVGTTSYYISALLFEHWNLEPLYIEMLKGLDFESENDSMMESYIDTLDVVRTAVNVKEMLTSRSIDKAALLVTDMGLDAEHFKRVANRIKIHYTAKKKDD